MLFGVTPIDGSEMALFGGEEDSAGGKRVGEVCVGLEVGERKIEMEGGFGLSGWIGLGE